MQRTEIQRSERLNRNIIEYCRSDENNNTRIIPAKQNKFSSLSNSGLQQPSNQSETLSQIGSDPFTGPNSE